MSTYYTKMSAARSAYDFVIAGAGVSALSTARYLARAVPRARIALVTPHAPMSQTSSLSTECFRDHWPSAAMRSFMGRSIELIDAHAAGGAFRAERAGYLYCSMRDEAAAAFAREAAVCHGTEVRVASTAAASAALGSAPFTFRSPQALGADVFATPAAVNAAFPYLSSSTSAAMHTRNCGWLVSAHTMGMDMLDSLLARRGPNGEPLTELISGSIVGADVGPNKSILSSVTVARANGSRSIFSCGAFINASGPFLATTHADVLGDGAGRGAGNLPVTCEVHSKVIFRDVLGIVPRDAPQVILTDPVAPIWAAEELEHIADTAGQATADRAASVMASGAHFRTYGGEKSNALLLLWEPWHHGVKAVEPPPASADEYMEKNLYPEVALRGLAHLVPGLAAYFDEGERAKLAKRRGAGGSLPQPVAPIVDGGYYTKTAENVPLVGPAPGAGGKGKIQNAFLCGAVSGYGIMAAHAAGELAAQWATGGSLPSYAKDLDPLRYQDHEFMRKGGGRDQLIAGGGGQL